MIWLDIFFVNFILCVMISIVKLVCVKFLIVLSILLIILGFNVEVGLLNNNIFGFIDNV